jgi:hypothetical protein
MAKSVELTGERVEALVAYIRGKKTGNPIYPQDFDKSLKRALRQQAESFEEVDGVLFHRQVDAKAGEHVLFC